MKRARTDSNDEDEDAVEEDLPLGRTGQFEDIPSAFRQPSVRNQKSALTSAADACAEFIRDARSKGETRIVIRPFEPEVCFDDLKPLIDALARKNYQSYFIAGELHVLWADSEKVAVAIQTNRDRKRKLANEEAMHCDLCESKTSWIWRANVDDVGERLKSRWSESAKIRVCSDCDKTYFRNAYEASMKQLTKTGLRE